MTWPTLRVNLQELPSVDGYEAKVSWRFKNASVGTLLLKSDQAISPDDAAAAVLHRVSRTIANDKKRLEHWGQTRILAQSAGGTGARDFAKWLVASCPERFISKSRWQDSKSGRASVDWTTSKHSVLDKDLSIPIVAHVPRGLARNSAAREVLRSKIIAGVELSLMRAAIGSRVHRNGG